MLTVNLLRHYKTVRQRNVNTSASFENGRKPRKIGIMLSYSFHYENGNLNLLHQIIYNSPCEGKCFWRMNKSSVTWGEKWSQNFQILPNLMSTEHGDPGRWIPHSFYFLCYGSWHTANIPLWKFVKSLPVLNGNHQIVQIILFLIRIPGKANSYVTVAFRNGAEFIKMLCITDLNEQFGPQN